MDDPPTMIEYTCAEGVDIGMLELTSRLPTLPTDGPIGTTEDITEPEGPETTMVELEDPPELRGAGTRVVKE